MITEFVQQSNFDLTDPPESATILGLPTTVAARVQRSFLCSVEGGTPASTVSWLRNGEVIEGATSETYSTRFMLENDGDVYQCRGTNYLGSVLSEEVTVSVAGEFAEGSGPVR